MYTAWVWRASCLALATRSSRFTLNRGPLRFRCIRRSLKWASHANICSTQGAMYTNFYQDCPGLLFAPLPPSCVRPCDPHVLRPAYIFASTVHVPHTHSTLTSSLILHNFFVNRSKSSEQHWFWVPVSYDVASIVMHICRCSHLDFLPLLEHHSWRSRCVLLLLY